MIVNSSIKALNNNVHVVLCFTHPIVLSSNAQGNQQKKRKERGLHGLVFFFPKL